MTPRSFWLFVSVTAFILVAAVLTYPNNKTANPGPGARLFPGLTAKTFGDVKSLTVTSQGKKTTIQRTGANWTVKQLGNYPADATLVKTTLVGVSQLRPYEKKTADSNRLDKLDLEDPTKAGSASRRITIMAGGDKVLADIVIGKRVSNSLVYGRKMVYLRKPDSTQSYLAVGDPQAKTSPVDWAIKKIMNIHSARIKEVVQGDGKGKSLIAYRPKIGAEVAIRDVPAGKKLKSAQIRNYIMEALQGLTLEDVSPASKIDFAKYQSGSALYTTYDGITVIATLATIGKKVWIKYDVRYVPSAAMASPPAGSKILRPDFAKKQVAEIRARVNGWAYSVSSSVYRFMEYGVQDILKVAKKPAQ